MKIKSIIFVILFLIMPIIINEGNGYARIIYLGL